MELNKLTCYRLLMVLGLLLLVFLDFQTDLRYRLSSLIFPLVLLGNGIMDRKTRPVLAWVTFATAGVSVLLWVMLLLK